MIDQLCQAYHWSYAQALSMTMPQMLLLSHAASVNGARMKATWAAKEKQSQNKKNGRERDPVVMNGKRLSQLTFDEKAAYYSDWS